MVGFLVFIALRLVIRHGGESAHVTVLWILSVRSLLTGDLSYNKVHLWLRENRAQGWVAILDRFEAAAAHDLSWSWRAGGVELIAANREYIEAFVAATAAPATKEQAIAVLKSKYPDYALPDIVVLSVGGRLDKWSRVCGRFADSI